jgi:hypothetical protein
MRRWTALWAALALVGGACQASEAAAGNEHCAVGSPLPGGEITYVHDGRLVGVAPDGRDRRCLGRLRDASAAISWAPSGDRALAGTTAVVPGGSHPSGLPAVDQLTWSPAGRSLLAVTPTGALIRKRAGVDKPQDITFLNRHETATYHPSGRAIVSVGEGNEGYGLYLADTDGKVLASLVEGETARHIGPLAWTENGDLVFAAQHDDRWDLHRLELGGAGRLTTLASTPSPNQPISDVVASVAPGAGIAWRQGDCADGILATHVLQRGRSLALSPEVATARPAGWLPDGTLVLQTTGGTCRDAPRTIGEGDIYAVKDGHTTRIGSIPGRAAVRVALSPGPELPSPIASAGPI